MRWFRAPRDGDRNRDRDREVVFLKENTAPNGGFFGKQRRRSTYLR